MSRLVDNPERWKRFSKRVDLIGAVCLATALFVIDMVLLSPEDPVVLHAIASVGTSTVSGLIFYFSCRWFSPKFDTILKNLKNEKD